ncbi:MAG: hypothetical protein ABSH56_16730 [Bryobacteraceae bacterium]|jgi:hypothetical protein
MFRRSLIVALLALAGALAQPALTTIQDVLYNADGSRFNGILTISWATFQSGKEIPIIGNTKTYRIVNGNLYLQLTPTAGASPAAEYLVTYYSSSSPQYQEVWNVPSNAQSLTVAAVRTSSTDILTDDGATIAESSVIGLVADLAARATMGAAFVPSGAVVVDSSGLLETATGNATDCVYVDGSSGPCGGGGGTSPTFIDAELPAGTINGVNASFTLANAPSPAASLDLYRNGLRLAAGSDYYLSGNAITFVSAATPQTGDTLLADYRTATTEILENASLSPAAMPAVSRIARPAGTEVLCSGPGTGTSQTASTVLGTCNIAAGILHAGDRVEIHFDLAHQGTAGTSAMTLEWGATTITPVAASANATLITGRAQAGLLASGAQTSWQAWGSAVPFSAGVGAAPDAYANGLTIAFLGNVTRPPDTLTLTQFAVVRVP